MILVKRHSLNLVKNNRFFRYLKSGGIIVYPTESSFGIGCDPSNFKAVKKIMVLKKRNANKNFILISASIQNTKKYIKKLTEKELKKANKKWPGPHTWIMQSKDNCPKWLKKNDISDKEMLKTFNCGVGFCLIINPKNLKKINRFFSREFRPYIIGKIVNGKNKVKLNGKVNWS